MFLKMFTKKNSMDFQEFNNNSFFRDVFTKENISEDLKLILDFQKKNKINNFYSFGCGNGVLENIVEKFFSDEFNISCYDINSEQINFITKKLHSKIFNHFDFINGNFDDLNIEKNQINCAFFSRSLYVCNEEDLYKVFANLEHNNINFILDIHDGCFTTFDLIPHLMQNLKFKISKKFKLQMRMHGYAKNFKHYEKIIKKKNFKILLKYKNKKNEPVYGIKIK